MQPKEVQEHGNAVLNKLKLKASRNANNDIYFDIYQTRCRSKLPSDSELKRDIRDMYKVTLEEHKLGLIRRKSSRVFTSL